MKAIVTLIVAVLAAITLGAEGVAGPYRIDLMTDPVVVPVGRAKLIIRVSDSEGKPISGATVKAIAKMPGMAMGEREETAIPASDPGTYVAPAVFAMAGAYEATISITGPKGAGKTVIGLQTGASSGTGGGSFPWGLALILGSAVLVTVFIVIRMRQTGQRVNPKGLFSRQVLLSLLVLGGALVVAIWAVRSLRREGSMTPIESQVMDMNAPAPEGTLPVRLATAQVKPFSESVTYSGQAAGYVEQDVVPRVTGTILWMPGYVGDNVTKGQLLARLDTTQLDPMVSEKAASMNAAQQGIGVASLEYQQALAMVSQARAEKTMAQGELDEARAMLDAAQQGRGSVEAGIASAQAETQAMRAELSGAEADREYQRQELDRMKSLFGKGAVSKDEFQRAQADAARAESAALRARENVSKALSAEVAARAELRKTDAEIGAARRKVQQAAALVRAKDAGIRTAQAGANAAKGKIGQSEAGVAEAAAGLRGATTQRGYAELRAESDGVITKRLVSPGTVVAPGQAVLKIAQVKPIRLQANVPEVDLARIKIGAAIRAWRRGTNEQPVLAKVTSVSPSLDPNSRMGTVEAIIANDDLRFLPGQYLSMAISLGAEQRIVVLPRNAVVTAEEGSYVWLAEPAGPSEYAVTKRDVQVSGTSGDLLAIKSGIAAGDRVVLDPPDGLVAGGRVNVENVAATPSDGSPQIIEITEAGYVPPTISVPAGRPFKVTFIRRATETCGTEIVFPDLHITKPLPLNEPVTVDIPAQAAGSELHFTCGMNMLKGKAVAR